MNRNIARTMFALSRRLVWTVGLLLACLSAGVVAPGHYYQWRIVDAVIAEISQNCLVIRGPPELRRRILRCSDVPPLPELVVDYPKVMVSRQWRARAEMKLADGSAAERWLPAEYRNYLVGQTIRIMYSPTSLTFSREPA